MRTKDSVFRLRLSHSDKDRLQQVAKERGVSTSTFILLNALQAANQPESACTQDA